MALTFHCSACQTPYPQVPAPYRCLACDAPLECRFPTPTFPRDQIAARPADMWRFREALPPVGDSVSLGEARTPLIPFDLEGMTVLAKCDHTLPTGSYKDRGAALLMSYLHALGIEEAVEDSSGNAGAALAAYAARAKMRLKVFCPASASAGKLVQIRLYGAELIAVEGPRARATEALLEYMDRTGAVYASHLWHPLFIEGLKTLAFELAEQLDWTAPDAVICPVGAGSILLGLYRGFVDLQRAGVVDHLPRLIAVQAEHVSPLYQAFTPAWKWSPPPLLRAPPGPRALPYPARLETAKSSTPCASQQVLVSRRRRKGHSPGPAPVGPGRFLRGAYFGCDLGRPAPSPSRRSGGAGSADRGRAFGSRSEGGPTHRQVVSNGE